MKNYFKIILITCFLTSWFSIVCAGAQEELLFYGIDHKDMKIVSQAIHNGAKINFVDRNGKTALNKAIFAGNYLLAEHLLRLGALPNLGFIWGERNIIHVIRSSGRPDYELVNFRMIELLVNAGANIYSTSENGNALHAACSGLSPSERTIKYLIQNGLDVNYQNNKGETPLMSLITRRIEYTINGPPPKYNHLARLKAANMLVGAGANPQLQNKAGKTALQLAIQHGDRYMIEFLSKI